MLEMGHGVAAFARGNFYGEPSPQIEMRNPSKTWHLGKVLFEQWWLAPLGLQRETWRLAMTLGSKTLGIPAVT
jgi:hypothetical protein